MRVRVCRAHVRASVWAYLHTDILVKKITFLKEDPHLFGIEAAQQRPAVADRQAEQTYQNRHHDRMVETLARPKARFTSATAITRRHVDHLG